MIAALALLSIAQAQEAPKLTQEGQNWLLASGKTTVSVPLSTPAEPPKVVRYRKGDRYVVWDERGLTTRDGKWTYSTRLPEVPVSPKIFSKDEILKNLEQFKGKQRSQEADAISGAVRIGGLTYLLPRWQEKGNAWLEALVVLNIDQAKPKPKLVGRFDGLTLAGGPMDDRLFAVGEKPAVIARKESDWGLATYDPASDKFEFKKLGERLRAHAFLGPNRLAFVEALDYGPSRVGVADLKSGARKDLFETRGVVRLIDAKAPLVTYANGEGKVSMRNVDTGAVYDLPAQAEVRRTALGLLAWWPRSKPQQAALLDGGRMSPIATWEAVKPPDPGATPSRGGAPARKAPR